MHKLLQKQKAKKHTFTIKETDRLFDGNSVATPYDKHGLKGQALFNHIE